ncbi:MAG: aspartate/glutamate racemase family protein [bacterium]|nr:aspartate/glutamate racemase family protein [bacterium]MDW7985950.1 aspartate/glutamate racemase family protein [Nitrososphaerota archaeon]
MLDKVKIYFIIPCGTAIYDEPCLKTIDKVKKHDTIVDVVHLSKGPEHVEYHYFEHIVMDETLDLVRRAERDGYTAVVIDCFYDLGLREARELVKIPVIGIGEASYYVGAMMGHKFSVLVGRRKSIPKMYDNLVAYGLERRLASFRSLELNPVQMIQYPDRLKERIIQEAEKAIYEDQAEVIILGCGAQTGLAEELMKILHVPVIDPVAVSIKIAEMLSELYVKLGLSHCKLFGYESPPPNLFREII